MGGGLARLGAGGISSGAYQTPQGEQCVVSPRGGAPGCSLEHELRGGDTGGGKESLSESG